jgi:hypothetical protein
MTDATLSTPFLGLPLLLSALLLLALYVAVFARESANWSSLFGGLAALATVWLFATVLFDKVWDALWLPKDALGAWPPVPTAIAAVIALPAGAWLERRLRLEEIGPVLTGVLDGCSPRNVYEWAASIGFLAFAVALAALLVAPEEVAMNLSGPLTWLGLAGTVATGGGLLAGGASFWRSRGVAARGVLMALVGGCWCLAMFAAGLRIETQTLDSIAGMEHWRTAYPEMLDKMVARDDLTAEEHGEWERHRAMWHYVETGVSVEYLDAQGETVLFEPDDEADAFQRAHVLVPMMMRQGLDNARMFRSLWLYVALGGLALGLVRPLRLRQAD